MRTLLVLGSKPEPRLPDPAAVDAVACANASGVSARKLGLPRPLFTCMTALLSSGKPADEHSLRALAGLTTDTLYYLPRPALDTAVGWRRVKLAWKLRRMRPAELRRRLADIGYRYTRFVEWPAALYHRACIDLAGGGQDLTSALAHKQPSTGMVAIALALREPGFERVVVAGFDFTLTHAYGENPRIRERHDAASKHAETDIHLLRAMAAGQPRLATTEPTVAARTGLPLVEG